MVISSPVRRSPPAVAFLACFHLAAAVSGDSPNLPREATGADVSVFQMPADVVIHVDPVSGEDRLNHGAKNAPLRTLGKALDRARRSYAGGSRVRIELADGSYREEGFVEFDPWKPRDARPAPYLHIKAATPHAAIITGCDDWTGDQRHSSAWIRQSDGVYWKRWHRDWGFEHRGIAHGPDRRFDRSLIARREYVLIDGYQPLRQVMSRREMVPDTFFVDDTRRRLYLYPPAGKNPNRDRTEVAVRPHSVPYQGWLWTFRKIQNLKIQGLTFSGAACFPNGANLHVGRRCKNVLIEDCLFQHNGAGGFSCDGDEQDASSPMPGVTDLTVQNCVVRQNGTYGFSGGFNNGKFIDNQFLRNNVRGNWAGYTGWSIAGAKFVLTKQALVQRSVIAENLTGGLWFDIHCRDVVVRDCSITGNVGHPSDQATDERGVFLEISEGPSLVENCQIDRNHIGIQIGNSRDVTIRNCQITNNLHAQIGLEGRPRGASFPPHNQNLLIYDNQVFAQDPGSALVREIWSWGDANIQRSILGLRKTTLGRNQYQHPCPNEAFIGLDLVQPAPRWQPMHFNRWKRLTGQDRQGSTLNGRVSLGGISGCKLGTQQCDRSSGVTLFDGGVGDFGYQDNAPDWICFEAFDFQKNSNNASLSIAVPPQNAGGQIQLRIDAVDGPLLGTLTVKATGRWDQPESQSVQLRDVSGSHDLFLVAKSGPAIGNIFDLLIDYQERKDRQ